MSNAVLAILAAVAVFILFTIVAAKFFLPLLIIGVIALMFFMWLRGSSGKNDV